MSARCYRLTIGKFAICLQILDFVSFTNHFVNGQSENPMTFSMKNFQDRYKPKSINIKALKGNREELFNEKCGS
jgi:hypothetical protein